MSIEIKLSKAVKNTKGMTTVINVVDGIATVNNLSIELQFKTSQADGVYDKTMFEKGGIFVSTDSNEIEPLNESWNEIGLIPYSIVTDLIKASNFVSKDALRPVLSCIYVSGNGYCATDAYRLMWKDIKLDLDEEILIIPEVFKLLKLVTSDITVYKSDRYLKLSCGLFSFTDVLNKVLLFTNPVTKKAIFTINDNLLTVSAEDADGGLNTSETLNINLNGEVITIGLNVKFLLDYIKTVDKKQTVINIEYSEPNRAIIIDGVFLLIPMFL